MSNDATFNTFGAYCDNYVSIEPIYLSVRREVFLNMDIGNPDDPYDYDAIAKKVIVYCNDIAPPFSVIIPTDYEQTVTVYPCDPVSPVQAIATLKALRIIASGTFAPIVASATAQKVFAGETKFIGLDQIVEYIAPDDPIPDPSDFNIDIDLENGPVPSDTTQSQYIGYTNILFTPDNPTGDSNGPGTYFFVVKPEAKIKLKSDPS